MTVTWILIFLIAIIVIQGSRLSKHYMATENDYYVVYNINDNDKSVIIWFMPVVAINIWRGEATPITSNENYVRRIIHHPEKGDEFHSYGHWIRNDQIIDSNGIPDDDSFSGHISYFIYHGYNLSFANSVPDAYAKTIDDTLDKFHNDEAPKLVESDHSFD